MNLKELASKLEKRSWWAATSVAVQKELLHLAKNDWFKFAIELADFPDEIGEIKVLSLNSLAKANFALICPVFNVLKGDKQFTYEFATWKFGTASGAKGIIFLRGNNNEVTHFVILRSWRFALGCQNYDCVGGFTATGDFTLSDTISREVDEEVGSVGRGEAVDLGRYHPDAGMTNNNPAVMAIFAEFAPKEGTANKDPYESTSEVAIFPISEWRKVAQENTDGFFFCIMMRAFAKGLISLV